MMKKYNVTYEEANLIERHWLEGNEIYNSHFRVVGCKKNIFGKVKYWVIESDLDVNKILGRV